MACHLQGLPHFTNAVNMQDDLAPAFDFLRRHAPFDRMASAHVEYLAQRLSLAFYSRGDVIVDPDAGVAERLHIVKQGRVRGESEDTENGAWELVPGESFPIGALLARRRPRTVTRAVEDTFCYELDREAFDALLAKSTVFHDFCTRRLANLLDSALRRVQAKSAARVSEGGSFEAPLRSLVQRNPVTCAPTTPLQAALEKMHQAQVGSIVVVDPAQAPVGLLTLKDVLSRVVLNRHDLSAPITEVMTPDPVSLAPDSPACEAAIVMAQRGFTHICVVERGCLVGVLSERDLFSLQRIRLVQMSRAISGAEDIATLAGLERNLHRLVDQMLAQGASVDQLTRIITTFNDSLTERVIQLTIKESELTPLPFTWLSFGSEGRGEQTLRTDQDNGILFEVPSGSDPDEVRAQLLPLAKRINEALAECGFPLCPGQVMAGNPECCLSLEEWQQRFDRWIDQGTPEHLLKATIYFDFRPLYGDPEPAQRLRLTLTERVSRNSRFRRQLAATALRNRPPLGLFHDFRLSSGGDAPHTLDLKVQGLAPFVDSARLLALANSIGETNTSARLQAAAEAEAAAPADVDAWLEAYHYIQLLRMRNHRRQGEAGAPLSNRIDPDTLNELDRRILKEAFRQARKLQSKIALEYQL